MAEATARSTALIAAVWLLLRVCRMRDPGGEKLAWTVVIAASLAMPLLVRCGFAAAMPLAIVPGPIAASMHALAHLPTTTHPLGAVLLSAYFLGVATFAVRLAVGLLIGIRLCRNAQPAPARTGDIDVRLSGEVQGPVSFGAIVLLPACSVDWDARTMRAVLAHEREHICNHDGYRLWLAALCRAFFWFNPLVHWLCRRLTLLTELTSDAAAVTAVGDRSTYVNVLLQIATGTSFVQTSVPMAARSTLPGRISELLAGNERAVTLPGSRRLLLGLGVALMGALISACAAPLVMAKAIHVPDLKAFYPDAARRIREEGNGAVHLCIDTRGRVTSAEVASSTGHPMLDDAMLKLAKAFRFNPATRAGRPVNECTGMPVKFVLSRSG
ncbi:MAG: TonB family protein [Steroidobacteraceae bacterium]